MPKAIISHNNVNEKLENVTRLLDIPRFWGPLATIVFTIIYHYGALTFGYSIAVMPLVLILAFGAFVGGLRAGLICAVWITLYTFYAIPDDLSRVIQIGLGSVGVALVIGWQTRKIRQLYIVTDELVNGNVDKAKNSLRIARELIEHWEMYTDTGRLWQVRRFEDALGNLLAGVVGYRHIRREIQEVEDWHSDPENVQKLQQRDEVEQGGSK